MLAISNLQKSTEISAVVDVKIQYGPYETEYLYRVYIDKVTGYTQVFHEGAIGRTQIDFQDDNDPAELEERALLACIHFPSGGANER